LILSSEDVLCPDTGTPMRQCGTARRIVREPDHTFFIWIPVFYSPAADRYHRVLPDFLLPFKHYITNVLYASAHNPEDLDPYDLPSDSSRTRWCALDISSLLVKCTYRFLWPANLKTTLNVKLIRLNL
jgi:hypothetical protein